MDAAEAIRTARSHTGLSQAAFAARAGTSQAAVARYESGSVSPSYSTLERLLHAAGMRPDIVLEPVSEADLSGARAAALRQHRKAIQRIARQHGATNVRVFGSVARGEDRSDSDVDLLVDFDAGRHGLLPIKQLVDELSELLGERVDVAPVEVLRPEVAASALADAVPL